MVSATSKATWRPGLLGLSFLILAGCGEDTLILPGERFDVREPLSDNEAEVALGDVEAEDAPVDLAFTPPAQVNHSSWTHRGGSVTRFVQHPALSSDISQAWSASIGAGNSRKSRITADPVVQNARVFALDSAARVSAFSTSGAALWSKILVPASDRDSDASGGGLAIDGDLLVVTTGFGDIFALDPATGAQKWKQKLDAPVTAAPTIKDGLVYVVTRDNAAWAIETENGRIKWQLPGTPAPAVIAGGSGAVIGDRLAVFPFGSGQMSAALKRSGIQVWGSSVAGQRRGVAYASINDITGDPVLVGDRLYAANQGGRTVALELRDGSRIWTANEGAYSPVYPVGNSVFLITDRSELVRLNAETGETLWSERLPFYTRSRLKRRDGIFAHYGPLLAGGRLIVASEDGVVRSFDPESGAPLNEIALRGGAASNPVVVDGTLYIVTANGQLTAFR